MSKADEHIKEIIEPLEKKIQKIRKDKSKKWLLEKYEMLLLKEYEYVGGELYTVDDLFAKNKK